MKKSVLVLVLTTLGWGSTILGYNVHDRYDHVNVVLKFDTPYVGKVTQAYEKNAIFIDLDDVSIHKKEDIGVYSIYLSALHLYPKDHHLILKADVPEKIFFTPSISSDGYTLRLRFAQQHAGQVIPPNTATHLFDPPTTPTDHTTTSQTVMSVLTILGLGFALAFALVIAVRRKEDKDKKASPSPEESFTSSPFTDIRFQKALDSTHTVVMIHTYHYEYLLLLGGGESLLLDTFVGGYPMTYEEFESLLRYHYVELKPFFDHAPSGNTVVID